MKTAKDSTTYKSAFSNIVIIFNPNSTGGARAMAEDLKTKLTKQAPRQKIVLKPTQYAGHAEELAYEFAKSAKRPLIISASGDGGYHEAINGLLRANNEGARAVAGLLPAGNANDHYHHTHQGDMAELIAAGKLHKIDLLQLDSTMNGKPYRRFAHSYIGLGLTPKVGKELNKVKLNRINELWIVLKGLCTLRPVSIIVNGKRRTYDSLLFSNVRTMSKVLKLSDKASNTDGVFELTAFKRRHKVKLLLTLLRASTTGLADARTLKQYHFGTIQRLLVQLDGEIATIDANADVDIKLASRLLECIV